MSGRPVQAELLICDVGFCYEFKFDYSSYCYFGAFVLQNSTIFLAYTVLFVQLLCWMSYMVRQVDVETW
jgi:hypothetical protein